MSIPMEIVMEIKQKGTKIFSKISSSFSLLNSSFSSTSSIVRLIFVIMFLEMLTVKHESLKGFGVSNTLKLLKNISNFQNWNLNFLPLIACMHQNIFCGQWQGAVCSFYVVFVQIFHIFDEIGIKLDIGDHLRSIFHKMIESN